MKAKLRCFNFITTVQHSEYYVTKLLVLCLYKVLRRTFKQNVSFTQNYKIHNGSTHRFSLGLRSCTVYTGDKFSIRKELALVEEIQSGPKGES